MPQHSVEFTVKTSTLLANRNGLKNLEPIKNMHSYLQPCRVELWISTNLATQCSQLEWNLKHWTKWGHSSVLFTIFYFITEQSGWTLGLHILRCNGNWICFATDILTQSQSSKELYWKKICLEDWARKSLRSA